LTDLLIRAPSDLEQRRLWNYHLLRAGLKIMRAEQNAHGHLLFDMTIEYLALHPGQPGQLARPDFILASDEHRELLNLAGAMAVTHPTYITHYHIDMCSRLAFTPYLPPPDRVQTVGLARRSANKLSQVAIDENRSVTALNRQIDLLCSGAAANMRQLTKIPPRSDAYKHVQAAFDYEWYNATMSVADLHTKLKTKTEAVRATMHLFSHYAPIKSRPSPT
jgi:hypothetical protein